MSRTHRKPFGQVKTGAPYLRRITSLPERMHGDAYPFTVPAFRHGIDLELNTNVTFFVGENGSGKSTLLEALAEVCGFNPEGGSRDHHRETFAERSSLARALRLAWFPKTTDGFFLRAESFFNFATYLDGVSDFFSYGGKSLHEQSHGESSPWFSGGSERFEFAGFQLRFDLIGTLFG